MILKWSKLGQGQEDHILSTSTTDKHILVNGDARSIPFEFMAEECDRNIPVTINGQEKFVVSPTREISQTSLVLEEVLYHIKLELENKASCIVVLKWFENGQDQECHVLSASTVDKHISVTGDARFHSFEFSAVDCNGSIPVTINGQEALIVCALLQPTPMYLILEEEPYHIKLQLEQNLLYRDSKMV